MNELPRKTPDQTKKDIKGLKQFSKILVARKEGEQLMKKQVMKRIEELLFPDE